MKTREVLLTNYERIKAKLILCYCFQQAFTKILELLKGKYCVSLVRYKVSCSQGNGINGSYQFEKNKFETSHSFNIKSN